MSATFDLGVARTRLSWLRKAKPTTTFGETLYTVFSDTGKDVTSTFTPNKVSEFLFIKKYYLTPEQRDTAIRALESRIERLKEIALQESKGKIPTPVVADAKPDVKTKTGSLIYNVGSVSHAYLTSGKATPGSGADNFINFDTFTTGDGNAPQVVAKALDLWNKSSNHKGMISTWSPPTGVSINAKKVSGLDTAGSTDPNKYAFQFLYNPQPVTLAYRGSPAIDVSQYTSGNEEYALWAGGGSGGTISFDLLLMRMYDLPYYQKKGAKGFCTNTNIYPGRKPRSEANKGTLFNEQDMIYNKGTMYDLEFLFRTVMGITIDTQLRGTTADIGWIGALPVELHLGPGLRYWGTLSGLTVNHVVFNERMVPVFSTVAVEFNRLPDYNWKDTAAK